MGALKVEERGRSIREMQRKKKKQTNKQTRYFKKRNLLYPCLFWKWRQPWGKECTQFLKVKIDHQPKASKQTRTSILPTKFFKQPDWIWKWIHPQRPALLIASFWTCEIWSRNTSQTHHTLELHTSEIVNSCCIKPFSLW